MVARVSAFRMLFRIAKPNGTIQNKETQQRRGMFRMFRMFRIRGGRSGRRTGTGPRAGIAVPPARARAAPGATAAGDPHMGQKRGDKFPVASNLAGRPWRCHMTATATTAPSTPDCPPLICADCFHEQCGAATLYCPHHQARATFDPVQRVWLIRWPVARIASIEKGYIPYTPYTRGACND